MAEKGTINSDASYESFCAKLWGWYQVHKWLRISVMFGRERKAEQNDKMWPMLADISKQVVWYGKTYDSESWKDILTGSFKKAEFVPNVDGTGFVVLGMRTSKMNRREFYDLVTFIQAFGDTQGIVWSEPSKATAEEAAHETV